MVQSEHICKNKWTKSKLSEKPHVTIAENWFDHLFNVKNGASVKIPASTEGLIIKVIEHKDLTSFYLCLR